MFCCPSCFVSPGHSYQSVHCLKKKEEEEESFPSHNTQTIEMAHMHEH